MGDDLLFIKTAPARCRHCRRFKMDHKALTFHCPIGRGAFPRFHKTNTFTEKQRDAATKESAHED